MEAAAALKITASDLREFKVIDEIVSEPEGAAHTDPTAAAKMLDEALGRALDSVLEEDPELRIERRHEKFRQMGNFAFDDLDAESSVGEP